MDERQRARAEVSCRVDIGATPYLDGSIGRMVTPEDPAASPEPPVAPSRPTEAAAATAHGRDDGPDPVLGAFTDVQEEEQLLRRTDAANGEYFARLHGDRARFDHRRRHWLIWSGDWWRNDDTDAVRRLAKETARQRFREAHGITDLKERTQEARFAIGSDNRYRLDAMLTQARSEAPIADAGDRWDRDPWLLGVANGVIDLRTGRLRAGVPDDRITLHSDVPFDPDASRPRWDRFVDEVFDGDTDLVAFVQRAVGYSLTGEVTEQCLFLCHGTGANGKSVFLRTLLARRRRRGPRCPSRQDRQRSRRSWYPASYRPGWSARRSPTRSASGWGSRPRRAVIRSAMELASDVEDLRLVLASALGDRHRVRVPRLRCGAVEPLAGASCGVTFGR